MTERARRERGERDIAFSAGGQHGVATLREITDEPAPVPPKPARRSKRKKGK